MVGIPFLLVAEPMLVFERRIPIKDHGPWILNTIDPRHLSLHEIRIPLPPTNNLNCNFIFSGRKLRTGDFFTVDVRTDNHVNLLSSRAQTWTTLQTFTYNVPGTEEFDQNEKWYVARITSPPFTNRVDGAKFRIRTSFRGRFRKIFIDNVQLTTTTVV